MESQYLAWVKHSPTSYVAHLATGIYYKKIGQDRRGDGYANQVSDDQMVGMEQAFTKANQQLNASLALDDKPLLTYLHLINITQYLGDHAGSRRLYDRSVSLDPGNFIMRQNYMNTLQTRWGGSVEEMQSFLKECQHAGLSAEHYKFLESLVIEDQAWVHETVDGNLDAARKEYEEASKLDHASICLPCGPISHAANLALQIHNYKDAIKQFSKILAVDPGALRPRAGRGLAELQLGNIERAVADIQYAADHGDAYAQDLFGKMYLLGTSIPQDQDKAIEWIKKAADQGYRPAISLLPLALNRSAKPLPMPGDLRM